MSRWTREGGMKFFLEAGSFKFLAEGVFKSKEESRVGVVFKVSLSTLESCPYSPFPTANVPKNFPIPTFSSRSETMEIG